MRKSDFAYTLPANRIAQLPLPERAASRLLVVPGDAAQFIDSRFEELPDYLRAGDLLVLNDTRVLPARLRCRKDTGGRVELLLERVTGEHTGLFQTRASKPLREGQRLTAGDDSVAHLVERKPPFVLVRFDAPLLEVLGACGEVPLPPYIEREAESDDAVRYQTVYARSDGAVAAPTAGLHFDSALLERLQGQGIDTAFLTLHVGAGTFKPVQCDDIDHHTMHSERVIVGGALCRKINAARAEGRRIVAIGTTVVRALETAWQGQALAPFDGETALFITPGYTFRAVDALVTNFHLPESTLLMLVCAFGGYRRVMAAYRHAVAAGYRFYSYGDAMLVERDSDERG